jgi:hypothetical protein
MKLLSADDVREVLTQNDELKKYGEKLTQLNNKLQQELEQTKNKLHHLEELTKFASNPIAVGSNEEELCKLEINRLYQAAKVAPLEFTQVKAFEIYVKSLMLIKGKSLEEPKNKKSQKVKLDHEELLQLALQVVDDTNEQ